MGFDAGAEPWERLPAQVVVEVGKVAFAFGFVEEGIDVGVEEEPLHALVVAPREESVAYAESGDFPALEFVDGGEAQWVEWLWAGGGAEVVDRRVADFVVVGAKDRNVAVGLDDVEKPVESPVAAADIAVVFGNFECGFDADVDGGAVEIVGIALGDFVSRVSDAGLGCDAEEIAVGAREGKFLIGVEAGVAGVEKLGADVLASRIAEREGDHAFGEAPLIGTELVEVLVG